MTNLTRWNPTREMLSLRRAMDRMFEDFYGNQDTDWDQAITWSLPLDVVENEGEYLVKASIPGMNPDDLEITYDNNVLTIRGEIKSEEEKKGERYHMRERRYGSFSRSISLPTTVNPDGIQASYENGVLNLHLPKTEDVKPRKIAVQGGHGAAKVLEGQARK